MEEQQLRSSKMARRGGGGPEKDGCEKVVTILGLERQLWRETMVQA